MIVNSKEQQTIREYLLGGPSQEDLSRVEKRLLTDNAFYEELVIGEDELIDQYLNDTLSLSERQSFETHFLAAPERQKKLRFARTFHKYLALTTPSALDTAENVPDEEPDIAKTPVKENFFSFLPFTNSIVSYSLAAAILVAVGGVAWVIFNNWGAQTTLPGTTYVATLTPGLTRDSGEVKRLSLPPATGTVQLRLVVTSDEDQSYRAELLNSERTSVLVFNDLKPQNQNGERLIQFAIPARILKRDDYQVRLSIRRSDGSYEEIPSYQFRVND
ncbi:MAG TPA: hypothetical protein VMZ30_03215 [Pyrinomonadaceae bacterium]|nr:hypothetical protein [Pyrinomonadaceae bacterium]